MFTPLAVYLQKSTQINSLKLKFLSILIISGIGFIISSRVRKERLKSMPISVIVKTVMLWLVAKEVYYKHCWTLSYNLVQMTFSFQIIQDNVDEIPNSQMHCSRTTVVPYTVVANNSSDPQKKTLYLLP